MSKSNNTRVNHNNHKVNNHIETTTTNEEVAVMQTTITTEETIMENNTTAQETPRQEIETVMGLLEILTDAIKNVRPALTNRKEFLKLLVKSDLTTVEQELVLMEYTEMVNLIENAPSQRTTETSSTDSLSSYIINGRSATQQEAMSYFQAAHLD